MTGMLHRFPVKQGDCFIIPGRVPHAIGPGVFLLEVQEPTDWVVQPERVIGDTEITPEDMWGPLTPEIGLNCFDYESAGTFEVIERRVRLAPRLARTYARGVLETLAGPPETSCFLVQRLTFEGEVTFDIDAPWQIMVVTGGFGGFETEKEVGDYQRGFSFFIPHSVRRIAWSADEKTTMYLITR